MALYSYGSIQFSPYIVITLYGYGDVFDDPAMIEQCRRHSLQIAGHLDPWLRRRLPHHPHDGRHAARHHINAGASDLVRIPVLVYGTLCSYGPI